MPSMAEHQHRHPQPARRSERGGASGACSGSTPPRRIVPTWSGPRCSRRCRPSGVARPLAPARLVGFGRHRRRRLAVVSLIGGHYPAPPMGARVLVVDNYDSFVYNLVQYLGELGAEPIVHRHDALSMDEFVALDPDGVLISPGPGHARRRRAEQRADPALRRPWSRCSVSASACSASARSTAVHRAGPAGHARQDVADPPPRRRRVRRAAEPARSDPLPLARRRPGVGSRPSSRSPPRPTTARSWACATAGSTSRACSSTPSRSSPSAATTCSAPGSTAWRPPSSGLDPLTTAG